MSFRIASTRQIYPSFDTLLFATNFLYLFERINFENYPNFISNYFSIFSMIRDQVCACACACVFSNSFLSFFSFFSFSFSRIISTKITILLIINQMGYYYICFRSLYYFWRDESEFLRCARRAMRNQRDEVSWYLRCARTETRN